MNVGVSEGVFARASNTTGYTGCGTLFACLLYPVPPRVGDGPGKLAPV
eukprot:SAG31_NODE_24932_length_471_cov_1.747312_1_plen_47_part_10